MKVRPGLEKVLKSFKLNVILASLRLLTWSQLVLVFGFDYSPIFYRQDQLHLKLWHLIDMLIQNDLHLSHVI